MRPRNVYVMGAWYYSVRVEEKRKVLSYLQSIGAVTHEGNFNRIGTDNIADSSSVINAGAVLALKAVVVLVMLEQGEKMQGEMEAQTVEAERNKGVDGGIAGAGADASSSAIPGSRSQYW